MMHGQIISRLYTTLINLSLTTYRERTKQKKREKIKKEAFKLSSVLLLKDSGRRPEGGVVNGSQSEFLNGTWLMSQN
jgi:hypothetical protein